MKQVITTKGVIFIILVLLLSSDLYSQRNLIYTHYLKDPVLYNPAIVGTRDGLNMMILNRNQWVGMDGAPSSFSFSAHSPYIKYDMGLGLNIATDKAGPVRNTQISASYAYQIMVFEGARLSMGLRGGISHYYASVADLYVNDAEDPNFMSNDNYTSPNLGTGFYLYTDTYYAGFSIPTLFEARINKQYRDSDEPYNPQMFLMGGYNFDIDNDWSVEPSMLVGIMPGVPMSTSISVKALYLKQFHFGSFYRIGDATGLFFGAKVYDNLTVGYGFDFTLNRLSSHNNGSHEFMISYVLDDMWNKLNIF